jgi:hypothetical protein
MRFIARKDREARVIRKFALVPITIRGETRWMEWVRIEQVWCQPREGMGWWENQWFR